MSSLEELLIVTFLNWNYLIALSATIPQFKEILECNLSSQNFYYILKVFSGTLYPNSYQKLSQVNFFDNRANTGVIHTLPIQNEVTNDILI